MALRYRLPAALCMISVLLMLAAPVSPQTDDQPLSTTAHQKYDMGKLEEAEVLFFRLLQEFSSSPLAPDAQFYLGWIAYKQQTGEAEARWQAVVDRYPASPEAPKALKSIAAVHYKQGASKESRIAEYENIIALYPQSPEAEESRLRIGVLHRRSPPDFGKALAALDYLLNNASDAKWRAEACVEIGLTYLQRYWHNGRANLGDRAEAMRVLLSVRATFPGQSEAVARGELRAARYYLYSERDPAKARQALNDILQAYLETTWTTEILYHIAYCSYAEKNYDECIQLCEDILADRPPSDWNSYLQYFIGNCHLQAGRKASAKEAFDKTISLYPGTRWAKNAEGVVATLELEEGP